MLQRNCFDIWQSLHFGPITKKPPSPVKTKTVVVYPNKERNKLKVETDNKEEEDKGDKNSDLFGLQSSPFFVHSQTQFNKTTDKPPKTWHDMTGIQSSPVILPTQTQARTQTPFASSPCILPTQTQDVGLDILASPFVLPHQTQTPSTPHTRNRDNRYRFLI